jgi:hypothetical protein
VNNVPAPKRTFNTVATIFAAVFVTFLINILAATAVAGPEITISQDDKTVIVNDVPEQEVYVVGRSVLVKTRAKGVLAIGGDVVIEGNVSGDVATIGGNVIQKEAAYIGGDVIVVGGAYKPESENPLRESGKETVMLGVFEDELRSFGQSPSSVLAPELSMNFIAQRLLLALVWFIISMLATTLAPGAFSRAIARIQLTPLKVAAIGAAIFIASLAVSVTGAMTLPSFVGATVGFVTFLLLIFGYVFGRVALQLYTGKFIQRRFLSSSNGSETTAILIGVLIWTTLLSLPYIWVATLFAIFVFGIGLILTGRTAKPWKIP